MVHVTTVPLSLRFLRGQKAFMAERGFELSFVSSPGPELDRFADEEGARLHAVRMERRITPAKDLVALFELWRHFRRERPNIVHAHTPKGGLLGTIAARLARVPARVYHMRGLPLMGAEGPRRLLLTVTERLSCTLASEVICVSHSLAEVAVDRRLVRAEKIRVLAGGSGQGVDASGRFEPDRISGEEARDIRRGLGMPDDAIVFLFVGRLVRDKGIAELVRAWKAVARELPDAHLVLVGDYEPEDPVDEADRVAIAEDERVHQQGFDESVERYYAAADVVVLPTYREGFPNVPLEAASMQRPVIATRIPGCVDAVQDGVTGLLVPPRDWERLSEAMITYARSPDLRRAHGAAGRERVLRDFTRERIWESLADRYVALLSRQPSSQRGWQNEPRRSILQRISAEGRSSRAG